MIDAGAVLQAARRHAGLSQAALARRAGTSQPTLAAYESGRRVPRLDTLQRLLQASGHEAELVAKPVVRRGAVPVGAVSAEVREILSSGGERDAWRRLLDFVDDFRASPPAGRRWLVGERPAGCGDYRFDAAIAALVELLCGEVGLPAPSWTDEPDRFAEPWWFVSGLPGFEAMALRDSPIELKRHGVFVNEGAFDRA